MNDLEGQLEKDFKDIIKENLTNFNQFSLEDENENLIYFDLEAKNEQIFYPIRLPITEGLVNILNETIESLLQIKGYENEIPKIANNFVGILTTQMQELLNNDLGMAKKGIMLQQCLYLQTYLSLILSFKIGTRIQIDTTKLK